MSTWAEIRIQMTDNMSLTEVKLLCFDLGINADELPDQVGISDKIASLLWLLYQRDKQNDLLPWLRKNIKEVAWPQEIPDTAPVDQGIVDDAGVGHSINVAGDLVTGKKGGGDITEAGRDIIYNYNYIIREKDGPSAAELLPAALELLTQIPTDATAPLPPITTLPAGSRMPLHHNANFVGRRAELLAIATSLKAGADVAIGQAAAVTGLGGIGKTQLAAEFVHRYGQYFAGGVFWLDFSNPNGIESEIARCGETQFMALLPGFDQLPGSDRFQMVWREWQSKVPRLLIFDNLDEGGEALL